MSNLIFKSSLVNATTIARDCGIIAHKKKDCSMHPKIETFLSTINALHQLEPKNLPQDIVHVLITMTPEELYKTCSQFAVLLHNVPSPKKPITLSDKEIASLAEAYLKGLLKRFK